MYSSDKEKKLREEDVFYNFCTLLDNIQQQSAKRTVTDPKTGETSEVTITLHDILQCITGYQKIPYDGVTIEIEFQHRVASFFC